MKISKKFGIAAFLTVISATIVTSAGLAVFTDSQIDDTTIRTGDVNISVTADNNVSQEDYVSLDFKVSIRTTDNSDIDAVSYTIKSEGNKRSYIRAQVIPVIQKKLDENWVTDTSISAASFSTYVITGNDVDTGSWIYSDGYYYYPNILAAGETTNLTVGSNVQIGENMRIVYDIDVQASQATHKAYTKNWNIDELPAGVQLLEEAY